MKIMRLLLVGPILFFILSMESLAQWKVWVRDGKTESVEINPLPAKTIFTNYIENLRLIGDWNMPRTNPLPAEYDLENFKVRQIGPWRHFEVFDVTNEKLKLKTIILRDPSGTHKILYAQFYFSTASVDDYPRIRTIAGESVLIYRTRVPGTGNFYDEYYWLLNNDTGLPEAIDLSPIDVAIKKILPEKCGVWKGGGLNFENLSYSSGVWQEGDGNCCPTAGRIDLILDLVNGKLTVTARRYNPNFKWR
ncbi:MAG TPA: hypothetical protein P5204_07395 [Kiritimatiellia bacterium]|nr:hypothetical protein [Kiritimatiellia bacterium]